MTSPLHQNSDVAPGASEPLIRLVDLHKAFGSLVVLDGVSLDLHAGQTTVILGPSGTGKSVLLKHIVGLLRPDRGEVHFESQRIDHLRESQWIGVRRRMGILFQMGALFDSMTVAENIVFPLVEHTDMSADRRAERCDHVLRMVGLGEFQAKMPASLSGGQRKRVALARAIVLEPSVVLYDEPTTGLDPIRADVINELIVSLSQRTGITSIVVTHDMGSATKIADRMVMLYDGKVIADADPLRFKQSDNEIVQRFIQGRAERRDLELIRAGFGDEPGP